MLVAKLQAPHQPSIYALGTPGVGPSIPNLKTRLKHATNFSLVFYEIFFYNLYSTYMNMHTCIRKRNMDAF